MIRRLYFTTLTLLAVGGCEPHPAVTRPDAASRPVVAVPPESQLPPDNIDIPRSVPSSQAEVSPAGAGTSDASPSPTNISERQRWQSEWKQKIDQLQPQIDRFEERMQSLSGDARQSAQQALDKLKVERDHANVRLKELGAASGTAWEHLKTGFTEAWDDLKAAERDADARIRRHEAGIATPADGTTASPASQP